MSAVSIYFPPPLRGRVGVGGGCNKNNTPHLGLSGSLLRKLETNRPLPLRERKFMELERRDA